MSCPQGALMVVTDLDGTLLDSGARLSRGNRAALHSLGERGVVRAVATGRSLHSARSVMAPEFPVDYLVFSTGAGILAWPSGELLAARNMPRTQALQVAHRLAELDLDFMIHHGIPENHHFHYHRATHENPDFERRLRRNRDFARPWRARLPRGCAVSQLLAIEPPNAMTRFEELTGAFPNAHVVRTTSPLDHRSRWLEIFPEGVSKASASDWVARREGVARAAVLAVGNDYNDTDLLEWAGSAAVVANGVAELKARFSVVDSNDGDGFWQAVSGWFDASRDARASTPGQ